MFSTIYLLRMVKSTTLQQIWNHIAEEVIDFHVRGSTE